MSVESLTQGLVTLEETAWQALANGIGGAFYRANLTDDALMVFPFGVLRREEAITSIETTPPWASFRIEEPHVVEIDANSALLTYRVSAQRVGQEPYTAYMTTVFVNRGGDWKTAFHQQSPTQ